MTGVEGSLRSLDATAAEPPARLDGGRVIARDVMKQGAFQAPCFITSRAITILWISLDPS